MPDVTDQTGIHVAATDGMVVLTCRSETVKTTAPMTPAAAEVKRGARSSTSRSPAPASFVRRLEARTEAAG